MYSIIANGENISEGVNTYLSDSFAELRRIKTRPGSKAYVIEDGKTYILTHSGEWKEFYSALKKYVDDKISGLNIDPEMLEELRILVDQIENGNIEQLIADKIEELNLVSADDVEAILQEKNYVSYNDTNQIVFYGGSATEI